MDALLCITRDDMSTCTRGRHGPHIVGALYTRVEVTTMPEQLGIAGSRGALRSVDVSSARELRILLRRATLLGSGSSVQK